MELTHYKHYPLLTNKHINTDTNIELLTLPTTYKHTYKCRHKHRITNITHYLQTNI